MKILGRDYSRRITPHRLHYDIGAMSEEIANHIPRMWKRSPSEEVFWNWFCGEVDSVVRNAADANEKGKLRSRLLAALSREGLPQPPPSSLRSF